MEEWRPVRDFDNYEISNLGRLRNKRTMRVSKGCLDKQGYISVKLYRDGVPALSVGIHRLMAEAFIDNPHNHPIADHINRKRDDNRLENLRFVSRSVNCHNKKKRSNAKTSNYFGVYHDKDTKYCDKNWRYTLKKDGVEFGNTRYNTEEEAARAYDEKARELYGEFARLNFP
jgi:hypothetical protein